MWGEGGGVANRGGEGGERGGGWRTVEAGGVANRGGEGGGG